jgi:hypothetical protein
MALDLFAGTPVSNYDEALSWYERLLGSPPSFLPNEIEAVWEVAEHGYLYIVLRPEHAGHAVHTLFVDDFGTRLAEIAARGLTAAAQEIYSNGVRKATYLDPDGNEIGFGGAPVDRGAVPGRRRSLPPHASRSSCRHGEVTWCPLVYMPAHRPGRQADRDHPCRSMERRWAG